MGSGLEWTGVGVSEHLKVGMRCPEGDRRALKFWCGAYVSVTFDSGIHVFAFAWALIMLL